MKKIFSDINKDSYNKIIDKWSLAREGTPPFNPIKEFAKKARPGGNILDIGCGTGYPIDKFLSDSGFNVIGIDISRSMIERATRHGIKNAKFYECDFFDYAPAQMYDGVVAIDSFFHFPPDKQAGIYERVANLMNTGAYLLFTHGKEEGEITGEMFGESFRYSALNAKDLPKLLACAGFKIVSTAENYAEDHLFVDFYALCQKAK